MNPTRKPMMPNQCVCCETIIREACSGGCGCAMATGEYAERYLIIEDGTPTHQGTRVRIGFCGHCAEELEGCQGESLTTCGATIIANLVEGMALMKERPEVVRRMAKARVIGVEKVIPEGSPPSSLPPEVAQALRDGRLREVTPQ